MYKLLIKSSVLLITVFYGASHLSYLRLALFVLIALSLSLMIELLNEKISRFLFVSFFILSFFCTDLIYVYPIVIQASYRFDVKYFLLAIPVFLIKSLNFLILGVSLLSYLTTYFEFKLEKYSKIIYDKEDEFKLSLKENKIHELEILKNKEKDIEIAILSERNRIAREIHDSVGHTISGAIIQSELMRALSDGSIDNEINALQKTLKTGMKDIRLSLHKLHDTSIDLELSLKEIAESEDGIEVEMNYKISSEFSYESKYKLISILKETISNSLKHSDASKISVSLIEMPKHLSFVLHDNGSSTIEEKDIKKGLGFLSFKDFAEKNRGRFTYEFDKGLKLIFLLDKEALI